MDIILNEREYVERLLTENILPNKPVAAISRIARYYYHAGYKKQAIGPLLESYILRCDPCANIVKWQNVIDRSVRSSDKYDLIEIDCIPITQAELDICKGLEMVRFQRLMFTLICLAKLSNAITKSDAGWVNVKDKEFFRLANVAVTIKEQSLMLNDLRESGLVSFSKKVDNVNVRVDCLDKDGDPVAYVSDFRNLGNQYMLYTGSAYMNCVMCGLTIKRTGRRQKYCPSCSAEVNKKNTYDRLLKKQTDI